MNTLYLAAIAYLSTVVSIGALTARTNEPKFITTDQLKELPVGIKVVHEPKVVLATETGKSTRRSKYTWWYKTSVSAIEADVKIVEFGAFVWLDGNWVNGRTFTGKPFSTKEFAEWYKCPEAMLRKGKTFSDPTNWSSGSKLQAAKMRWYFVGMDSNGNKVRGEAVIELKDKIDPRKPKDPN